MMFLPTHYTAIHATFHDGFGGTSLRASNEAVMVLERGIARGCVKRCKVVCADGLFAWLDAADIYKGARR